ncbi:MAG: hypothetical protein ACK5GN_07005 [Pseudomonadota bacterium]
MYHDTIPTQKSIFEFALRARKITILGALATQFHEISGLAKSLAKRDLLFSSVA